MPVSEFSTSYDAHCIKNIFNNKKGFTLIELLSVIVILAIILAIAVPVISGVVKGSTRETFESNAKLVLTAINYKMLEDETFDPTTVNETNIKNLLNMDSNNYQNLTVKKVNGQTYITIVGKGKWENLTVSGTKRAAKVSDTVTTFDRGANTPVLAPNMTPIKWNGATEVPTDADDPEWYNYNTIDKKWANAKTEDGSYWVWIPRYIYKISSGWHTSTVGTIEVQFSKGVDDNWNKSSIGSIDVDETSNASNAKWTNHPAFTFGDIELTGIWVAKFEASGTTSAVKFEPNVNSLLGLSIGDMFTALRNLETNTMYGWTATGDNIDTHLMKNSEWGAVAYLAQSTYGKNAEIVINNSNSFITGCAGSAVSDTLYFGCEYTYTTPNGQLASTTGNIYGIYDMSGGAYERVSSYVDVGTSYLTSGGNAIINAEGKYKDVYTAGAPETVANNYDLSINKKGDAIYETSSTGIGSTSWNGDSSSMPTNSTPWFARGGLNGITTRAGAFSYYISDGTKSIFTLLAGGGGGSSGGEANTMCFRSVLLVEEGL